MLRDNESSERRISTNRSWDRAINGAIVQAVPVLQRVINGVMSGVACFFAGALLLTFLSGGQVIRFWNLEKNARHTMGVVRGSGCGAHAVIAFSYTAGGRTREGHGLAPRCPAVDGSPIDLWYSPDDPSQVMTRVPQGLFENELATILLAGVVFGVIGGLVGSGLVKVTSRSPLG